MFERKNFLIAGALVLVLVGTASCQSSQSGYPSGMPELSKFQTEMVRKTSCGFQMTKKYYRKVNDPRDSITSEYWYLYFKDDERHPFVIEHEYVRGMPFRKDFYVYKDSKTLTEEFIGDDPAFDVKYPFPSECSILGLQAAE